MNNILSVAFVNHDFKEVLLMKKVDESSWRFPTMILNDNTVSYEDSCSELSQKLFKNINNHTDPRYLCSMSLSVGDYKGLCSLFIMNYKSGSLIEIPGFELKWVSHEDVIPLLDSSYGSLWGKALKIKTQ